MAHYSGRDQEIVGTALRESLLSLASRRETCKIATHWLVYRLARTVLSCGYGPHSRSLRPDRVGLFLGSRGCHYADARPGQHRNYLAPNGIVAALLIRAPKVYWLRTAACVSIAAVLVNFFIAHRPWSATLLFSGVNAVEIALSVWMFRSLLRFDYPNISINQSAIMSGLFGIANPGLLAIAGGAALYAKFGTPYVDGVLQWWGSHTAFHSYRLARCC